jgi:4-hydroxy-3-methylbut-2-enyl diphosphate reductase
MGQLPEGAVALVETVEDAKRFQPKDPEKLAFVTQTTLSVDDTAAIIAVLQARFPAMAAPHKEDICYATTNRQEAVKRLAEGADLLLVIGSQNSSNSVRLVEVGLRAGAKAARLIDDADHLDWAWLEGVERIGITAGASAPERLVEGLIEALAGRFTVTVEEVNPVRETVTFKLPRQLAEGIDAAGA